MVFSKTDITDIVGITALCCMSLVRRCSMQLTPEYSFHMIKIDDKAYMVSAEVSQLLWTEDIIRRQVSSY